jgi:hypothetical protein
VSTAPAEGDSGWAEVWGMALDALELEADQVERVLHDWTAHDSARAVAPSFQPPPGLGPLPLELEARARRLLQRQLALSAELTAAMHTNRQQAMLVGRLHQAAADPRPVFIDRAD